LPTPGTPVMPMRCAVPACGSRATSIASASARCRGSRLSTRVTARATVARSPASPNWRPPVATCSALTGAGLDDIWQTIGEHRRTLTGSGELAERRRRQQVDWMWAMVRDRLMASLAEHPAVAAMVPEVEREVAGQRLTPALAADRILAAFRDGTA
jgi:LAO/AO transport system kinase